MRIFVIHYKPLIDRKHHILEQFRKHNIVDYEFIEIDRDELHEQNTSIFEHNYSKSQMAISLSHFYAYKQISDNYENGLVFEDDIVLSDDFTNILQRYMSQLPDDYDMLFIGDGCGLHIEKHKITPSQYIYEKCLYPTRWGGNGATRCTDSYVINKKCAKQLCTYIDNLPYKINSAIDWWLNVAARENNLKVYWAEPTIVTQGTQNGLFQTSH
jgi:GR25 family glycosyltransferase involved in LPS biosynthesis